MTEKPETLGEISHTNPYTGRVFCETQTYGRGTVVAADGGERDVTDGEPSLQDDGDTLADISHTSTDDDDVDATQRTFTRSGREQR